MHIPLSLAEQYEKHSTVCHKHASSNNTQIISAPQGKQMCTFSEEGLSLTPVCHYYVADNNVRHYWVSAVKVLNSHWIVADDTLVLSSITALLQDYG